MNYFLSIDVYIFYPALVLSEQSTGVDPGGPPLKLEKI
jgi:hypothetical protein